MSGYIWIALAHGDGVETGKWWTTASSCIAICNIGTKFGFSLSNAHTENLRAIWLLGYMVPRIFLYMAATRLMVNWFEVLGYQATWFL
ncbi:hypothetical protein PIB30_055144, partial [Stylosanthes scabra]|nr:hypothetical protein [Stylosanthes scabra]